MNKAVKVALKKLSKETPVDYIEALNGYRFLKRRINRFPLGNEISSARVIKMLYATVKLSRSNDISFLDALDILVKLATQRIVFSKSISYFKLF